MAAVTMHHFSGLAAPFVRSKGTISGGVFTELPEIYLDAVVAVEDHRFEQHCGIDIIAIARAAWNNVKSHSRATGGNGLGLYLVKMILDRHWATCTIENTPEGVRAAVRF